MVQSGTGTRSLELSSHHDGVSRDSAQLTKYWESLPLSKRRSLLHVPRRTLFEAIRTRYCSRCFGLFALRYEELRCSIGGTGTEGGCSSCHACPACQDFFLGLKADGKGVTLEDRLLEGNPFEMFAKSKLRERDRDLQFMTAGDVCGSGFNTKRSGKVCALHTTCVSPETLLAYWDQLPPEHRTALFTLPRHDFEAELESCCSLQLRICKDCRYNVVGQYKLALAAGRKPGVSAATAPSRPSEDVGNDSCQTAPCAHSACTDNCCSHQGDVSLDAGGDANSHGSTDMSFVHEPGCEACGGAGGGCTAQALAAGQHLVHICDGFWLAVTEASVQLIGSDAAMLLEEADEIEDLKVGDDGNDSGGPVRHAETPELAQEALVDAVILIFKAQIEVAFREQTAGHNALLLLVALGHDLLESRLRNAALDVRARAAEVELLQLVEADERRSAARASRPRRKKAKQPPAPAVEAKADAAATASAASIAEDLAQEATRSSEEATPAVEAPTTPTLQQRPAQRLPVAAAALTSAAAAARAQTATDSPASSGQVTPYRGSSWDDNDDAGGDKGEWEVQQRGRRTTGRRPSMDTATPPLPQRTQHRKFPSGGGGAPHPGLPPPPPTPHHHQQQHPPHPPQPAWGGSSSSRHWPTVGAANGRAPAVAAPGKGPRLGQPSSPPQPVPRPPQLGPRSNRSSAEYNLWGGSSSGGVVDEVAGAMSLSGSMHPSSSRESLAAGSDASFAATSPPTATLPHHFATLARLRPVSEAPAVPDPIQRPPSIANMLGPIGSFGVSGGSAASSFSRENGWGHAHPHAFGTDGVVAARAAPATPAGSLAGGWAFDGAGSTGAGQGGFSLFCNFPVVKSTSEEQSAPIAGRIPAC